MGARAIGRVNEPRLGRRTARCNRAVTNHLARPLAARVPGMAVVIHRGRRSGREWRTPVMVFRSGGGYLIALTYGRGSDWVRNVLAAGGCDLVIRGRRRRLHDPEVLHDESRAAARQPALAVLGLMRVSDFLRLLN